MLLEPLAPAFHFVTLSINIIGSCQYGKEPCLPCLVVISLARGSELRSLRHRCRSVCAAPALLLPVLGRSGALNVISPLFIPCVSLARCSRPPPDEYMIQILQLHNRCHRHRP